MICDVCRKECEQGCERFVISIKHKQRKVGGIILPSRKEKIKICKNCTAKKLDYPEHNQDSIYILKEILVDFFNYGC